MDREYSQIGGQNAIFIKPQNGEEIVITGISGKFPDSRNVYELRDNLFNKIDMVTDDHRRWKPFHPEIPRRSGKLFDVEKFDLGFFGVTQVQANHMDILLRMLLEIVYEAVIDAGYNPVDFAGTNTGVIVASSIGLNENGLIYKTDTTFCDTITGSLSAVIPERISYSLKLKGPSIMVDTACSSSLYAIEEAYWKLLKGECEKVIVVGSNLCLHPILTLQFARLGVLSPDGACKSFDRAGNGYARSEAIVVILLERAKNAKRIYAEIMHTKTNCDGYKEEGITFPSMHEQCRLLEDLYKEIQVDPTTLTYLESHGTGTKVGDPEEIKTLEKIFCKGRRTPLLIGAVKSNLGHSEPASGLCSIAKVIIAMETGFIPPNIHFKEPRKSLEGLVTGKIILATEKTPLPDDRGLFGINNFGFGGANAHILLRWNTKIKVNNGIPKDNLPRLICVHGRTEETVTCILNDIGSRPLDAEHVYLIHQVFRKQVENNLYRGFGIFTKQGNIKRSVKRTDINTPKLYLVLNNFDKECLKLCHQLMELPTFANTMKCIESVVHKLTSKDFSKIFKSSPEENLTNQILGAVAVQISLVSVVKAIKLIPDEIVGFGSGELLSDYENNYLTLEELVEQLFSIITYSTNKNSLFKYMPAKAEKHSQNFAKYLFNNTPNTTNEEERQVVSREAVSLVFGNNVKQVSGKIFSLINVNSKDPIFDLLSNLGSLYEYGFDMELNKLYPNIELPVSRGTPMISPLIKWRHFDCDASVYHNKPQFNSTHSITSTSESWKFIIGHVIDGRDIFPATGYLVLVWETFLLKRKKELSETQIVFEDVKYIRAANVPKDGALELTVSMQLSTHIFEVLEGDVVIVTGKIYEKTDEQVLIDMCIEESDEDKFDMDEKDIYKELKLRGYQYSGLFRSLKKCTVDASYAIICWNSNWIGFLDSLLQLAILRSDSRNLYVPTSIAQLVIDAAQHFKTCTSYDNMVPAMFNQNLNVIRTEGIEVRGLKASAIGRKKEGDPVLEISKFVPNEVHTDVPESVRILVQIVLENTNALKAKVVEVCPQDFHKINLLCPIVQKVLDDVPSIKHDLTIFTKEKIEIAGISVENRSLNTATNCLILILTNVLETVEVTTALNAVQGANGYIFSKEELGTDLSKFNESPFNVICSHQNTQGMLVLLKPTNRTTRNTSYINLTNSFPDFRWIVKLQKKIRNSDKVVLYCQNDDENGLLGLSTCLQQEYSADKVKSILIMDDAPIFDPNQEFYKKQLNKNMAINVWKDGVWGTYRHLLLPESQAVENEHSYVNATTRGDLSTLTWLEGNVNPDEQQMFDKELIYVYYSALNFRDLMTATGKISPDVVTSNRIQQECVQGIEFAGRNSKGQRVMGMCSNGALASIVLCEKDMVYEIPEEWSMVDASTTVVVYFTVLRVFDGLEMKPGRSILIHSGTGGIGLAAINICIYYGLDIFVTVGTPEKRGFLKKHYPYIKEEHIGNSRDTSFESMVYQQTNGRGVDYVLNSLAEEKLLASVRCLARGGRFLEIGKFDLANNNALSLRLLEKGAEFIGIALDRHFGNSIFQAAAIKPLPRTVFRHDEVEQAFRFMGLGKHIGKVIIKIRNEEDVVCPISRTLFKATPRFFCNPTSSYLICGGLGGFGLELADFLVIRGAKNLILTSISGLHNGYQKYRIRMWKNYGVNVLTTTLDASTSEGCMELLNTANALGPLDGIFNLAAVLKDGLFENQTEADFKISAVPKAYCTKNLDSISRQLCPNLRYFVVFSSISCGRGNIGQTNYGMANSVMERICEKRKREGYPALAIQWGAVGEVGLVAKMQEENRELYIGGTLAQSVTSCLQAMDKFLKQNETIVASMLVAEKKSKAGSSPFDTVLHIMGIHNLKSISMHLTLSELGMDSMTAVEIKQTLEREYELFLTAQDIREMTLVKLKNLYSSQDIDAELQHKETQAVEAITLMLRYVGIEGLSSEPIKKMKTLVKDNEVAPHIVMLPGLVGVTGIFETLCMGLKAHVSCLQFCPTYKTNSIAQLASCIFSNMDTVSNDLTILAYSFGCVVAVELLHMLEQRGKQVRVIFLDGSPEIFIQMLKTYSLTESENLLQNAILSVLVIRYNLLKNSVATHQNHIRKLNTFQEKIDYLIGLIPFDKNVQTKYIKNTAIAVYERMNALQSYKLKQEKLKSRVTLFKASFALMANTSSDYGLSSIFESVENIVTIEGNHETMLENQELPKEINNMLGVS